MNFSDPETGLGNTVVAFDDRNYDGAISDVEEGTQSEVIGRYHYYSFGMQWNHAWVGSDIGGYWKQRYRYNGKELHSNSGLLDYGFRYYDPSVGRFTGVDPLAEEMPGWNPYHYVFNNPILLIDPLGLSPTFPPANFKGGRWIDGDGIFNTDPSGNGYHWTSHTGEDKGYVSGTTEIVESNFTMLSYLGHQISQYPNALSTLVKGAAKAISDVFSKGDGENGSKGNGANGVEVLGTAGIQGGISQDRKGSSDAIIDFGGGDFPNIIGAGGAGSHSSFWKLKSAYDGVDAGINAVVGGTYANELFKQRRAIDSFCINGSNCAFGGKPHSGFSYYRTNVFGVRIDTVANK